MDDSCKIIPPAQVGHPTFHPYILEKNPSYDILEKLEGTWISTPQTSYGIHTTCLPSPGTSVEQIPGKFTFVSENYTETLTFTKVPGGIRNRGGANEQIVAAIKYDQKITSQKTKAVIHEENGMYMWLNNMFNHPADNKSVEKDLGAPELQPGDGARGGTFIPSHTIARSGTVPHGTSIMLLGNPSKKEDGKPEFPTGLSAWDFDHLSISPTMGGGGGPWNLDEEAPSFAFDKTLPYRDPSGNKTYTQRIFAHELYPYCVRPDLRLRDTIKNQNIKSYEMIVLDTEFDDGKGPQGGVNNIPMINRFTPVKRVTFRMWIEEVEEEDGTTELQLQYEQVMFFEFGFGTDGGTTFWPHIQVNTLRKKEENH